MDGSNDGVSLGIKLIIDSFDVGSSLGLKLGTADSSSNGLVEDFDDGSGDGFEDGCCGGTMDGSDDGAVQ
jgi:hypothetical protein